MRQVVVGVADGSVSQDPDSMLVTYALGSCIAVMLHDPVAGVSGMVHYMLPESSLSSERSTARPWMFAPIRAFPAFFAPHSSMARISADWLFARLEVLRS